MRDKKINFYYFSALWLWIFALETQAIIVQLTDLHTMAKRSDVVIHGYVGEQKVSTDEFGRLITVSEVEVIDGLYGAKNGEIIKIYQVGGEKDGVVAPLIGGQHFSLSQELIFLGLKAGDKFVSIGAGLGKLDVAANGTVVEDLGNVESLDPKSVRGLSRPSALSFSEVELLKSELREMLKDR